MGRKKKEEEHENLERWLISYSDFITLLFALFVVLFAITNIDLKKLRKVSKAMQFGFATKGTGGTGAVNVIKGPPGETLVTGKYKEDFINYVSISIKNIDGDKEFLWLQFLKLYANPVYSKASPGRV